jgi:hypothetical protein
MQQGWCIRRSCVHAWRRGGRHLCDPTRDERGGGDAICLARFDCHIRTSLSFEPGACERTQSNARTHLLTFALQTKI